MQVVLAAYNLKLTDVSGAIGLTRTKIENPTPAVETSRDTGIPLSDLDAYITSTKDKDLATLSAPLRQYLSAGGQITELKAYSLLVIVDQKANVARIKEALGEYD
jgi:hypothetical protein